MYHDEDHAPAGPQGPAHHEDHASGPLAGRLAYLFLLQRVGSGHHRPGGPGRRGVFQGQRRVLHLLSLHSPVSQKELSSLLGIRPQSLAELVSKLEAAGLVNRHPDPEDRRTFLVEITEDGKKLFEAEKPAEDSGDDPFAVLDEAEQQQLADLLDRLIESFEQRLPEGPDRRLRAAREAWIGGGSDDYGHPEGPGGHGRPGGFPFGPWGPGGPWGFGGPEGFGGPRRRSRGPRE